MNSSLASLFQKITVMHSTERWSDAYRDLEAVLGAASFSDGKGWASFGPLSVSDEPGPAWSLLAKTTDLDAVARAARDIGWDVATPVAGAHETRLSLTAPSGLTVVAYSPTT